MTIVTENPVLASGSKSSSLSSSSYQNRHSTIATSIFFQGWEGNQNDNIPYQQQDCHQSSPEWKSLPSRLSNIVQHYTQNTHQAKNEERSITLSSDPMEARRIALTASIVVHAPDDMYDSFQVLFQNILNFYLKVGDDDKDSEEEGSDDIDNDMDENESWSDIFDFNEEKLYN